MKLYAEQSFLSQESHVSPFFFEYIFMGGRDVNGGSEALPEYFSGSVRLHPFSRLQANALLPRLHLSDSFGMFSNLHLFFQSGRTLAELPVCDSIERILLLRPDK